MYDVFYVEGCENRDLFQKMLRIMMAYCDTFSLIYFKYKENEKTSKTAKLMKQQLAKYKLGSRLVCQWPLTVTKNLQNHIYRMVTYKIDPSDFTILDAFETIDTLWELRYPEYPMDLCFYRDASVVFASCTHEEMNELYLRSEGDVLSEADFESIGFKLYPLGKVTEEKLFHLNQSG